MKYSMRVPMVAADSSTTEDDLITAILREHNAYRNRPLEESGFLNEVAKIRCEDMVQEQYFGHADPNGDVGKWNQVMLNLGAKGWRLSGENLWTGTSGFAVADIPRAVLQGFMGSPGHRENVVDDTYDQLGVAIQFRPDIGWNIVTCIYAGGLFF